MPSINYGFTELNGDQHWQLDTQLRRTLHGVRHLVETFMVITEYEQ